MKNIFYSFLAVALMVSLAACSKTTDDATTDDADDTNNVEVSTPGVDVSEDGTVEVDLDEVEGLDDATKDAMKDAMENTQMKVNEDGTVSVETPNGTVTTDASGTTTTTAN